MRDRLKALEQFDTPSITNVIATYPKKTEFCLGLYHPWRGAWYTDDTLKCMFPELGPRAGVVVTVVYGMPDPEFDRLTMGDLLNAMSQIHDPIILAVKQNFPSEIKRINGLLGGNMMTAFQSMGVVGVLSDGPSRDVDEIRPMGMQYMLTGVTAGHGPFAIQAINVPVNICGMDVAPNDIVHVDENGAVKFPADRIDAVLENVQRLSALEQKRQALMRDSNDPKQIAAIMQGLYD
ncbi:MAG: RraA family protein [Eubacteriales bacterium]|nr:RraA family protein [Eubacteriales bacterium]